MRRFGDQAPRFGSWPDSDYSTGSETIQLAEYAGLQLDPWQKLVIEHANGRDKSGGLTAFEVALVVARQNGKSGPIIAQILDDLFIAKRRLTVFSAHEFKSAIKVFKELVGYIENCDDLRRRCQKPRGGRNDTIATWSHGDEGIKTLDGAELRVFARSRGSGRAFTGGKIYFDEALKGLNSDQLSAMLPMLASQPDQQIWYVSSAPLHDSSQLRQVVKRGRARERDSLAYFEWSCPTGADLDDPANWAQANPGMGYRITEEYIRKEKRAFGDDMRGWSRERLTIFDESNLGGVFDEDRWTALSDPPARDDDGLPIPGTGSLMKPEELGVFGVAVNLERTQGAFGTAGLREDGPMHVELVDHRNGTAWMVDRAVALDEAWPGAIFVIDKGSPAGVLIPDFLQAGLNVHVLDGPGFAAACARMVDMFEADALAHRGQEALTAAYLSAGKRAIGDGFGFSRRMGVDITPLESVTVAAHYQLVGDGPNYDPLDSVLA